MCPTIVPLMRETKKEQDIYFTSLIETMKILVATEKPFAKKAVDGIRKIVEDAGYELALAMMIFMSRNRFTPGTGTELQGKTLGIHAYGNVGRLVGRKGKALGMNVVAYDPFIADGAVFEADGV